MAGIVELELLAATVGVGGVVSGLHLPPAGDAGLAAEELVEVVAVVGELIVHDRARADDAHLTLEDVDELGELVEGGLAQDAADGRDARVVLHLALALPLGELLGREVLPDVVGVGHHGAELVEVEVAAVQADAALRVEGRTLALQGDHEAEDRAGDDHEDQHHEAEENVEDALEDARVEPPSPSGVVDGGQLAEVAERGALDGGVDEVECDVAGGAHLRGGVHEGGEVDLGGVRGGDEDVIDIEVGECGGKATQLAVDRLSRNVAAEASLRPEREPAQDLVGLANDEPLLQLIAHAPIDHHENGRTSAGTAEQGPHKPLERHANHEHHADANQREPDQNQARRHGLRMHDKRQK